tara:strand:+ start:172 stop:327 length:156 start_codon:yes stop_codon:yes gene_type:complete
MKLHLINIKGGNKMIDDLDIMEQQDISTNQAIDRINNLEGVTLSTEEVEYE